MSGLPPETGQVLEFWFEELSPEQWWKPDPAVDETIRLRFLDLYERLAYGVPSTWLETVQARLAAVIVLDQFPRNIYRSSYRAFATDEAALALATATIDEGLHETLSEQEKGFLFMPFQHSEDREVQARSVELFKSLDNADQLKFAESHKQVIDRFGRFPHRNECLGRQTTDAEKAFLEGPALFW